MAKKAAALPLDDTVTTTGMPLEGVETVAVETPLKIPEAEPTGPPEAFADPAPLDTDAYRAVAEILSPQKGKRSATTLVRYRSDRANALRCVHVDIKDVLLADAYRCWRGLGGTDDEEFLDIVYRVTRSDVPRMFRQVAFLDLDSMRDE